MITVVQVLKDQEMLVVPRNVRGCHDDPTKDCLCCFNDKVEVERCKEYFKDIGKHQCVS